jgi:hypothetical protein
LVFYLCLSNKITNQKNITTAKINKYLVIILMILRKPLRKIIFLKIITKVQFIFQFYFYTFVQLEKQKNIIQYYVKHSNIRTRRKAI